MNKKIIFFIWIFLSFMMPGLALSGQMHPIHVKLSYAGSAVSYNLYKDGVKVCVNNVPGATQIDCNVEIDTTPMTFVLTAVDAAGVESPQSAPYILVPPPFDAATGNFIPQAKFTTTVTSGLAPLPVSFDASGSSDLDGLIISYAWDFGDGGAGAGKLIDYTFSTAGTYTVTLTAVDDQGASAIKTTVITIEAQPPVVNIPPVAVITATPLLAGTSRIGFDAYKSSDDDGTIASYAWNFGDGDTAVGNYIEHEFKAAGNYTVVLTVTDNKGSSRQDQMVITVVDLPKLDNVLPVAVISASSQKKLVHFAWDYTGSDPGLAGFRLYQNGRLVCQVANPLARETDCLTYVDNGLAQLWVTSYSQTGVESAASSTLSFDSTGLFPGAGGGAPLLVNFTSGLSSDADGTITSYAWNFGDGSTAEGMAADHVFTAPGDYAVTMTVIDNSGGQAQATKMIKVSDINPPIASNASFSTMQGKSVTATLSANDPESRPLTFKIANSGSLGTATITNAATGVFTYVPKVGSFGADTFTFKANDGTFDSNEAVVSIDIKKQNSAPVAANQPLSIMEDTPVASALSATDSDSDPINFKIVTPPTHGVAVLGSSQTGAFQYTPQANYNGQDSFTFKANDGLLDSAVATVSITITPVNDAPAANPDSAQVESGKQVAIAVLGNDTDIENNPLTIVSVTTPAYGKTVIANGVISYTANVDFVGTDSFSYTINDGAGGTATGRVTITVVVPPVQINAPPIASNQTRTLLEDVVANGTLSATDSNKDQLTFLIVTPPAHGVATLATSGAFTYMPTANFNGTDNFTFKANDGLLDSAVATVSITITPVNDAPAANPDSAQVESGKQVAIAVLGNDTDIENNPLTIVSVTTPAYGKTVIANGVISYTANVDFVGTDSFSYTINDGAGGTATSTVTITVVASPVQVNAPPIASNQTLTLLEDVVANGTLSATDSNKDQLTFLIVTPPAHGVATLATSGAFTYVPAANFNGTDNFTFKANDGKADSAVATVSLTITPGNDVPVAEPDAVQVNSGINVLIDVLANDTDIDGDRLTVKTVSLPAHGKAVINIKTGKVAYTATVGYKGIDSFKYTISDGKGGQATGIVTIITNQKLTLLEDVVAKGVLSTTVASNPLLTFSIVTPPAHGVATLAPSGAFTYMPTANFNGTDNFTFKANDGKADSAVATVSLTITPVNDVPVAEPDAVQVDSGIKVFIDVIANDTDIDGDRLTVKTVSLPAHGRAAINITTGRITYTSTAGYSGTDSFKYTISDGKGGNATGTVTITVGGASALAPSSLATSPVQGNAIPTTSNLTLKLLEDAAAIGTLSATDTNNDPLTFSIVTPPAHGVATLAASGIFNYTPTANFNGTDNVTFKVNDGKADSAVATVSLIVTPVNDVPVAEPDAVQVNSGIKVFIDVIANDTDIDGDRLKVRTVSLPAHGTAAINITTGRITYRSTAGYRGTDSFKYTIDDGKGGKATGTATVTVL